MCAVSVSTVHESLDKWLIAGGLPLVADLTKSHGSYLHDARSGTDYLDFHSFAATRPLAYDHEGLSEPAFVDRLARAARLKPANSDIYTVEYAEFVDTFGRVACEGQFRHLFFVEGCASAVDNAVKAAVDWKHRKNIDAGRGSKGSQIVHFQHAFHGRIGYALSLTDALDKRETRFYPTFDWPRISSPMMRFPFDDAARADVEEREAKAIEEIIAAFDEHAHDIAGIIIEPIQAEGGDNYFRSEFLRELRRLCDEREALLIFDEMQTGFGTSGRWWDWQNHQARPDLLVFGKKAQVSGVAATDRVDEVESVFEIPSKVSGTFCGNLTDMVRCHRIMEIISAEGLVGNAATMGRYLLKVLKELSESHAEVSAVRGRGLWAAFDLPSPVERDRVVRACFEEELLVLSAGRQTIRLQPTLDVNADAIGRAAAQLEAGLNRAFGRRV